MEQSSSCLLQSAGCPSACCMSVINNCWMLPKPAKFQLVGLGKLIEKIPPVTSSRPEAFLRALLESLWGRGLGATCSYSHPSQWARCQLPGWQAVCCIHRFAFAWFCCKTWRQKLLMLSKFLSTSTYVVCKPSARSILATSVINVHLRLFT